MYILIMKMMMIINMHHVSGEFNFEGYCNPFQTNGQIGQQNGH